MTNQIGMSEVNRRILWTSSLVFSIMALTGLSNWRPRSSAEMHPQIPEVRNMGPLDAWKLARAVVEHEDQLVSDRMSSYLTIQGLLFAAIGIIVKTYIGQNTKSDNRFQLELPAFLVAFSLVICTAGIITSFVTNVGIQTAYDQNNAVEDWWNQYIGIVKGDDRSVYKELEARNYLGFQFPRFRGRYPFRYVVESLPLYLMSCWIIFFHVIVIWPSEPSKRAFLTSAWRLFGFIPDATGRPVAVAPARDPSGTS